MVLTGSFHAIVMFAPFIFRRFSFCRAPEQLGARVQSHGGPAGPEARADPAEDGPLTGANSATDRVQESGQAQQHELGRRHGVGQLRPPSLYHRQHQQAHQHPVPDGRG